MNEDGLQSLHDHDAMAERVATGEVPDWVGRHWGTFTGGIQGERNGTPFPCFFGVESVETGDLLYTVVPDATDKDALLGLRDVLWEYLQVYRDHAELASLVTFFAPDDDRTTEAEYHELLWHVLQFLHVHDPEPWPEELPTDPEDPYWEFSFGGEPMFPTCRAPFYERRKSRYCPVGLEITFQPRWLFEHVGVTADTEAGQRARKVIHERLAGYDGVCPHADIGDYGEDLEWPQYMLSEDPEQAPDECPIEVTREHPKVDPALDPGIRTSAEADR